MTDGAVVADRDIRALKTLSLVGRHSVAIACMSDTPWVSCHDAVSLSTCLTTDNMWHFVVEPVIGHYAAMLIPSESGPYFLLQIRAGVAPRGSYEIPANIPISISLPSQLSIGTHAVILSAMARALLKSFRTLWSQFWLLNICGPLWTVVRGRSRLRWRTTPRRSRF